MPSFITASLQKLKVLWVETTAVGFVLAVLTVARGWFKAIPPGSDVADYMAVFEVALLALGLISLLLLYAQIRGASAWNRILSYHNYFSELPAASKVDALRECLLRLQIKEPTAAHPLSEVDALRILSDEATIVDGVFREGASDTVRAYLNDFEEFAAAVKTGIVSDRYACELEGTRTINAYFGFERLITRLDRRRSADQSVKASPESAPFVTKVYMELRLVATDWRNRRQRELKKIDEKRLEAEKRLNAQLDGNGVPKNAAP